VRAAKIGLPVVQHLSRLYILYTRGYDSRMDGTMQPAELAEVFRVNMRARRRELGLNQEQLAKKLRTNQPHISDLENGTKQPTMETIAKIAESLSTTPAALLTPEIFSVSSI